MVDPVTAPFVVAVDQREKHPFLFDGLKADAKQKNAPLIVSTVSVHMESGDYSVHGMEDRVAVERKSKMDLYQTLGQGRDRFEDEHRRLMAYDVACVVVECSLTECLTEPPERSKLNPKTIFRTGIAWWIRYDVPWFFFESRSLAEAATYRILEKAWKELTVDC